MIAQYIFGGTVVLVSLILICAGVYVIFKGIREGFVPLISGIMLISPGVLIITDEGGPTKQDVLNGKAVYQESIHIRDNDTIKTYEIIWKQKN